MFDPFVADAEARNLHVVSARGEEDRDGLADPAAQAAVLDGDDPPEAAPHLVEQRLIEGFHETQVVMGRFDARGRSPGLASGRRSGPDPARKPHDRR